MKTLILIRGLPGAGKSSLVEALLDAGADINCYATDDWFTNEEGEYHFNAKKLAEYHSQCLASVEWDMSDAFPCIAVHNTFSTESELLPYLNLAKKYGYRVVSVVVEKRHDNENVHGVPKSTITKMRNRFSIQLG